MVSENAKNYPIYYVTYCKGDKIPSEVPISMEFAKKQGFHVMKSEPDRYKVPSEVKPYHAGFKHMKELTMPRIEKEIKRNKNFKGFFIAEGDLCLDKDYTFQKFIEENHTNPVWLGYKKKLSNYIVGNFFLYFPKSSVPMLSKLFKKKEMLVYSDRFFTNLVDKGFLKLHNKSVATEIEHYSNVAGDLRKESKCHISPEKLKNKSKKNLSKHKLCRKTSKRSKQQ